MKFDAEKLRIEMARQRWQVKALATEVGVERQTLHKWMNGAGKPGPANRRKLEAILGLGEGELDIREQEPPESLEREKEIMLEVITLMDEEFARRDLSPTPAQRTKILWEAYDVARTDPNVSPSIAVRLALAGLS